MRLVTNLISRLALGYNLGSTHTGSRQIEEVLGYKDRLTYGDFKRAYLRYDIAQRLVNAYPEETWSQVPTVQEDDQQQHDTVFEETWNALAERLQIAHVLKRADILANLGRYAVVLIGLRNQSDLAQPASPVRSPEDVLYLQVYSEEFVKIQKFGENASVVDFAQPTLYRLEAGTPEPGRPTQPRRAGLLVHPSRLLHVSGEYTLDDDLYGLPVLEAVYNKLVDLLKVVGGSAEMYWRDAKRRIAVEAREGYQVPETVAEEEAIATEMQEYEHGLRDVLRLVGAEAKNLSGLVASPKEHFGVLIQAIAGTRAIPQRILLGTEEGRLAGAQDDEAWLRRVGRRQLMYAEPRLLRPLIQRLGDLRALQLPQTPYVVDWGNLYSLSEQQRAVVAKDYATATAQYEQARATAITTGLPPTVSQGEFRSLWVGLPEVPEVGELDMVPLDDEIMIEPATSEGVPVPRAEESA